MYVCMYTYHTGIYRYQSEFTTNIKHIFHESSKGVIKNAKKRIKWYVKVLL